MDKKTKDIVKYRNEFNLTNLNALDKIEMDILFTICSKFTQNKVKDVEISFDELKEKAFLSDRNYSWDKSIQKFSSLADKILSIKFVIDRERAFEMMPIFNYFVADDEEKKITVELNNHFSHYLYDIPQKIGFSRFELEQFIFLRSKYSKTLFRFFLQNFAGKWTIGIDDLKKTLDFPDSYTPGKIIQYIDNKILPELIKTGYFSNIEIDVTTARKQGRPIKDVIFTYEIDNDKQLEAAGQGSFNFEYRPVTKTETKKEIEVDENTAEVYYSEKTVEMPVKCPCQDCDGDVVIRTDKNGKNYYCCTNNAYWRLGSADCSWREYID